MFSNVLRNVKKVTEWCLPFGLVKVLRRQRRFCWQKRFCENIVGKKGFQALANNRVLKNIHKDKRCFILGTGPSINKQNMFLLKGENCIYLNHFYLYKKFHELLPSYYLHAGIYVHPNISKELAVKLYMEMEKTIPRSCIMFLNYLDMPFILKNQLFRNHKVHYLLFKRDIDDLFHHGFDMCNLLYAVSNVVTRALQVAFYMGFSEIYLLGFEGASDEKSGALHFYDEKDDLVGVPGKKIDQMRYNSYSEMEKAYSHGVHFFKQLRIFQSFAKQRGIQIYNASDGGIIDFFPRVKFESLFLRKK